MAVGEAIHIKNGDSVDVTLSYTVAKNRIAVVQGWLGVTNNDGDSGDQISLSVDDREYSVIVPAALDPAVGDILYVTVATVTGHYPDDAALTTTAGSGKLAFLKITKVKDANNVLRGIMVARGQLAS